MQEGYAGRGMGSHVGILFVTTSASRLISSLECADKQPAEDMRNCVSNHAAMEMTRCCQACHACWDHESPSLLIGGDCGVLEGVTSFPQPSQVTRVSKSMITFLHETRTPERNVLDANGILLDLDKGGRGNS